MAFFVNRAGAARVGNLLLGMGLSIAEANGRFITVGIHEEEGGQVEEGGATLAEIGAFHEFGTSTIPRRSFLNDAIDEFEKEIREAQRRTAEAIVRGRLGAQSAYEQLGAFVVLKIQKRIREQIPPPLASSTIARKGSSVPLIDEGRLIASITSQVHQE